MLDLTENTKCLHFVMTWQGRNQQQFTHLLCELWRDEEREIHVRKKKQSSTNERTNERFVVSH